MTGWFVFAAYIVIGTLSLRPFYGRFRADAIDSSAKRYPYLCGTDPVGYFNKTDRGPMRTFAALASALWPLGWVCLFTAPAIGRYMDGTSVRSKYEADKEREAMTKRIADLERELNLR